MKRHFNILFLQEVQSPSVQAPEAAISWMTEKLHKAPRAGELFYNNIKYCPHKKAGNNFMSCSKGMIPTVPSAQTMS